jgi:hypothetical protein
MTPSGIEPATFRLVEQSHKGPVKGLRTERVRPINYFSLFYFNIEDGGNRTLRNTVIYETARRHVPPELNTQYVTLPQ